MVHRIVAALLLVFGCLSLVALPAAAQRHDWRPHGHSGRWERLGVQSVGFGVDRDIIRVGRYEGRFDAVTLRVLGNDIELMSARVVFGNGEVEELRIRGIYRAGTDTGISRLDFRARAIDRVELVYRSNPRFPGQAIVELWGLHAADFREPPRPVPPPGPPQAFVGPAWEMLGERLVDMNLERDVVPVGRWEGSFTKIRLKVVNHDIELRDVTIVYGNGDAEQWVIRRRVRDEEPGPVFDLAGHRRTVSRVILTYRATNPFARTTVQVWGGR